ncbi:MAG: hypothetical protein AAF539_11075 [Planctomycetota bacterium]
MATKTSILLQRPNAHWKHALISQRCSLLIASKLILGLGLVLGMIATSTPASATTLDQAIENIAEKVSSYLKEKGQTEILLKDFNGPGEATAGRAVRVALKSDLIDRDIRIIPLGANWTVRGSYNFDVDDDGAIVMIKTELVDKSGKEISGFRQRVREESVNSIEDIVRLLGSTVDLKSELESVADPSKSKSETSSETKSSGASQTTKLQQLVSKKTSVNDKVAQSIAVPTFAHRNTERTIISPETSSTCRIELLVRRPGQADYTPIEIDNLGGFPFAGLSEDETYKIRIYNDESHDIGVKLSVDGINSFQLAEDPSLRELGTWVIGAGKVGVIPGWYVSSTLAREFLVTAKNKVEGLPDSPSDLGTVTVQVFHAWNPDEPPPAVELIARSKGQLRTGVGRDITRRGGFQRSVFGKRMLSAISIRYSIPDDLPPGVE